MSSGRRPAVVAAGVLLGFGALAACGLPQDREPQKIASPLPDNLRIRESPATSGPQRTVAQTLYFVKQGDGGDSNDMLAGVAVPVEAPESPTDLPRIVFDKLLQGVSADEKDQNLITDIPANTQIRKVTQNGQTVTIDVNKIDLNGTNVRTAVAQIVFTLTSLPGVSNVVFLQNGDPAQVPIEGGTASNFQMVNRSDFSTFQQDVANEASAGLGTVPR